MTREAALAAFDEARDRFLVAFEQVPDAALGFLEPGDDYSIGGLLAHLTWGLRHYSGVLDTAVSGGFGEFRDRSDPDDLARAAAEGRAGLSASERGAALESLGAAHGQLADQVRTMPEADFERTAPVLYGDASEPFRTSAATVLDWMTEHYDEHIAHVGELLAAAGKLED
jgi:hypothetical protein